MDTEARANQEPTEAARAGVSLQRSHIVWMSLVGAMTTVGGLLVLLQGAPAPRVDGLAIAPLLASGQNSSLESVFATRADLARDRWTSIIIHHSGKPVGSPASIAADHRAFNLRGLGHHFVIGNGSGMEDGEIHAGYRWMDQLPGAHAGGPDGDFHNRHSISICLVGDGDRSPFSRLQISRLAQLVNAIRDEFGLDASQVLLHSEVASTTDPGRLFPLDEFERLIGAEGF